MTHTFVTLKISEEAFDEIRDLLHAAGYAHAIHVSRRLIDMHGLALERGEPKPVADNIAGGLEPIGESEEREGPYDDPSPEQEALIQRMVNGQPVQAIPKGDPTVTTFPIIPDTYPCVLYFNSLQDRDGFAEEVSEFDPNLQVHNINP